MEIYSTCAEDAGLDDFAGVLSSPVPIRAAADSSYPNSD